MLRRTRALRDPVTLFLDGDPIVAERGEPIAVALLSSDAVSLARSPKLHRPRGPSCLRGACDGCLARVSGEPNIMTCMRRAQGGEHIETQNVIGSRKADLLRVTDWFFPKGIDHHHFMAGVPGLSDLMQSVARKVAGLGTLPEQPVPTVPAERLSVDVLVVGAGPAGICVASKLHTKGKRICLVDDGVELGGSLLGARDKLKALLEKHPLEGVDLRLQRTVAGVYMGEALVATTAGFESGTEASQGALVIHAPAKIFATGCHDGTAAFPNNDLPGIFSARALCKLISHGIESSEAIVIAGQDSWADELTRLLPNRIAAHIPLSDLVSASGTSRLRSVTIKASGTKTRTIKSQILAIASQGAPAFEVAAQAGAQALYTPSRGYLLQSDARGRCGEGIWAVGECTGTPTSALELELIEAQADALCQDILSTLPQ